MTNKQWERIVVLRVFDEKLRSSLGYSSEKVRTNGARFPFKKLTSRRHRLLEALRANTMALLHPRCFATITSIPFNLAYP